MRQREAERLGDHLRGCGRAEKLAPTAGRTACLASCFRGFFERDEAVRKPRPDRLHFPGVLAALGGQRHTAGHEHDRQFRYTSECHEHRRQSFVARRNAHHARASRQRADEPSQHHRGIVAERQRIHHAFGALRAPIAWVGAETCKWQRAERFEFTRGRLHEQTDFPMAGVIAERDRRAVVGAQAAGGGEDEVFGAVEFRGIPAHARVEGHAEDVARGPVSEHVLGERERARGASGLGGDIENRGVVGFEDPRERDGRGDG